MAQFHVGTFCWADPGLALSQTSVQQNLIRPIRSHFSTMKCAFSSSDIPTASRKCSDYQPGGTLMATTGKWTTRSTGLPLKDPHGLGRWSGLCFLGKQGKRLAILTAYRSPRQQPTGGYGFLDQQHALLLSKGVKHPNVRKQFVHDIIKFINDLQSDGYEVMVNLDANETVSDPPSKSNGIRQIMDECSLMDLHSIGPCAPPATYKYGHHRKIDFMLGSATLSSHIRRFGFLAYDNGIFSKHRGLFVDLDFVALMGNVVDIPSAAGRRLQSENPLSVDRYLSAFKQYATDHNIWTRVQELITVLPSLTSDQCKACYDPIDRDVTRAMLHAEKRAKRPTGKYAWSPKLRELGLMTRYWHLRLKATEHGLDLRSAIRALATRIRELQIPLTDDLSLDNVTIKTKWKASLKELRKVRATAFDHRASHLLSLLEMYQSRTTGFAPADDCSDIDNKVKITRIQQLLNIEGMRKPFRAIHSANPNGKHSHCGGGLSKLFVPTRATNPKVAARYCAPDGSLTKHDLLSMAQADKHSVEYDTVIDGDTIHEEILQYNCAWFRQAKDTPFGSGVLYDLVGSDGLTEEADAIIAGECIEYMGVPMSRELQVFLEECKRPEAVSPISSIISLEHFKKTVKKWKESTSTSPSGRHLGHYKVSLVDDSIAALHTDMLNIPVTYGFAPSRWTHSVTPLIEKDAGKPYLTRLRVIHLFEADYNLFLKLLFGKRLVKNGERSHALNDQQHGSRPRRMTSDALFLSRLEKDILRQTRTNSAHMDNDATGCYDRIIPSLGMLACRRLGMPTNAIKCQADTLTQMKYSVKTAHGISSEQYSSTISEPLFGTGQGSGASPAIWLGLVVVLLNSLDRMSRDDSIPALRFHDPWGEMLESWRVGAFVDDTNQGVLDASHQLTPEDLVEYLRQAGQMWERLLTISGGKLNLAKCSWTLQFWDWKNGRPFLRPSLPADPLLILTSGANPEQHIITRNSNEAEIKGLGVYMNFLGTFSHHALQMRKKFDGIARRLGQSRLSPALTRLFYNAFYIPTVTYSLPVTSMTDIELHQIQSKMTAATLNKLGYNRHYPHVVAYASQMFFGCGLFDLRMAQGLAHVQAMLDYIGTDHKVGRVMLISLRHLQTEAGVSFDLLHHPNRELSYLTDCWMTDLRSFCAKTTVSIRIKSNRVPLASRSHDQFLMEIALTLGMTRGELKDLNLVRTYLGVTTISDIASALGSHILPCVWSAQPISDRKSRMTFARQQPPTCYQKGLWKRLLKHILLDYKACDKFRLRDPLGPWIAASNMHWGAMVWDGHLYRHNPFDMTGERRVAIHFPHGLVGTSICYYDQNPDWYSATLPRLATPADLTGDQIYLVETSPLIHDSNVLPPIANFSDWLSQLPPAEHRLVSEVSFFACDAETVLVQYLQLDCTVYVGTDGGKKEANGSFSWVICSPGQEHLIQNSGPVDGWHRCQSSLRSEAAAIASVTLYLNEMAAFYSINIRSHLKFFVDSMGAISNAQTIRDQIPRRRFPNNADLLSTLREAPHILRHYRFVHVKSHQDDDVSIDKLPFSAQLNVLCDELASTQLAHQHETVSAATASISLPTRSLPVQIFFGAQNIQSHYVANLRHAITAVRHRHYLQKKYKWPDHAWDVLACDSLYLCAKKTLLHNAMNRSKLVHNWLNLGSQRGTFRPDAPLVHRTCPYCATPEDFAHLLSCEDPRARKAQYDAMTKLRKAINGTPAAAPLLRVIKQWTATPSEQIDLAPGVDMYEPAIRCALASQALLGWTNFFRGFLCLEWGYIVTLPDPLSASARKLAAVHSVASIIRAVQDYSLALWKTRNELLHSNTIPSRAILEASLDHDITLLYGLRTSFSPIIQSYFHLPLLERLKRPLRHKQRWIQITRLATSHASARGSRQQVLSTYFPYAPVPLHHSRTRAAPISSVPICTVAPILQQMQLPFFTVNNTPSPS